MFIICSTNPDNLLFYCRPSNMGPPFNVLFFRMMLMIRAALADEAVDILLHVKLIVVGNPRVWERVKLVGLRIEDLSFCHFRGLHTERFLRGVFMFI